MFNPDDLLCGRRAVRMQFRKLHKLGRCGQVELFDIECHVYLARLRRGAGRKPIMTSIGDIAVRYPGVTWDCWVRRCWT